MLKRIIIPTIALGLGLLLIFAYTRRGDENTPEPTETPLATEASAPEPTHTPLPPTPTQQATPQATITPSPEPVPDESVAIGHPLTYTLTITNYGPSNATGVIITDMLPAGVEFISATSPYTAGHSNGQGVNCYPRDKSGGPANSPVSPTMILCDIGDMLQGASASITVVVRPITVTEMSHTAIVAGNETDPDAQGNVFDEQTAVKPAADLSIQADGSVIGKNTVLYAITITNKGPSPATGILVSDTLPLGATLAWSRPSRPACTVPDGILTCDLGQLDQGSATLTLDITPGISDTIISESLPVGVTFDVSGPTCTHDDGFITCHLGDLPVNENAHVTVAATVAPLITETFTNTVTATAIEIDPYLLDNRVESGATVYVSPSQGLTVTTIPTAADLTILADVPDHVIAGTPVTYTFTAINNGPAVASDVILRADLVMNNRRTGLGLVSLTPAAPDCDRSESAMTCYVQHPDNGNTITLTLDLIASEVNDSQELTILNSFLTGWPLCGIDPLGLLCHLGDMGSGDHTQVTLVASAGGLLTGTITRTATLAADEFDPNPLDNVALASITATVQADLALHSQVSAPVVAGRALTYTFTITNRGPSIANGVLLTDTLPPGVQFVSATASKKTQCEPSETLTNTVACKLYGLDSGVVITLSIAALVDDLSTGAITNLAVVVAGQADPYTDNNQTTQSTQVSAEADLSITDQ